MVEAVPTADELKALTPEERIKRLRALEEQRKKELEETKQKVEEELKAAEELIQKSEDEIDVEVALDQAREEAKKKVEDIVEENLEEMLGNAPQQSQDTGTQYQTSNVYQTIEQATKTLQELYGATSWSQQQQDQYQRSKENIERVQQYTLTSDRLVEELGLAGSALNKLRYRH